MAVERVCLVAPCDTLLRQAPTFLHPCKQEHKHVASLHSCNFIHFFKSPLKS